MTIRPKDSREEVALFRAQVIGALLRSDLPRGRLRAELERLSQRRFRPPGSERTRTYAVSTLERWLYRYRRDGVEGLMPKRRRDAGHGRGLDPELRQLLLDIRRAHPRVPAPLIRDTLIELGRLEPSKASVSLLQRLYREHGLVRQRRKATNDQAPQRLRWEAVEPMALWQGDVCHGPALTIDGTSQPLRIHALLDDASRYIVALEAHHSEREMDMLGLLVRASRRHGVPDTLLLDNGSTYRGEALSVACTRLGVGLVHCRPYDPQARGKIERFWRTLRERCLDFVGGLSSLHEVQVRLCAFLDRDYHVRPHAGLMGRTPKELWQAYWRGTDSHARRVDEARLRTAMTERTRRRVRKDSTLSHLGVQWELSQGYLAGRNVTVAHCLMDEPAAPWVEHQQQRYPLHPVDPKANARRQRPKASRQGKTDFDPATARLRGALGLPPDNHKEE